MNSENNKNNANNNRVVNNQPNRHKNNYNGKTGVNSEADDALKRTIERSRQKATAGKIAKAVNSVAPGVGTAAEKALNTEKGQELIDEYEKGSTPAEGAKNVVKKITSDVKKKIYIYGAIGGAVIFLFFLMFIVSIFKNADTQTYSTNGGKIDDTVNEDHPDESVFTKYSGLYQRVEEGVKKISDEFHVEVDKYLILATLLAPIENELVVPYINGRCDGGKKTEQCYKFEDKWYTWTDYLYNLGGQSEYLAKAQILTYYNTKGKTNLNVTCNREKTMEAYSKNDKKVNEWHWSYIFNPFKWFDAYFNASEAETNAICLDIPVGKSDTKPVYVISKDEGVYYCDRSKTNEGCTYVKDSNTGGVYFWNLVNEDGIIHTYFKDYLGHVVDEDGNINTMYEENLPQILDTAAYIYQYYESIRRDCKDYNVVDSTIENIKVQQQPSGEIIEVELEHYVGGVVSAEIYNGSILTVGWNIEAVKAFAILARSFAIGTVGTDGKGVIKNGSVAQNYNSNFDPVNNPAHKKAAEIVAQTKGLVVTGYGSHAVRKTPYDSFCPESYKEKNGFYYLPDGQNNLPINSDFFYGRTGHELRLPMSKVGRCPCYKNVKSRPKPVPLLSEATGAKECYKGPGDDGLYTYSPGNGHGRGSSQYGLRYFAPLGYDMEAVIKLFYDLPISEDYIALKRLSSSIEELECDNALPEEKGTISSCGVTFAVTDSNYTKTLNARPISKPLEKALAEKGYTVECLNSCISQRVATAGYGTREGAVEASVGLLECMKEMTGGTLPYSHNGRELNGKMGVNIKWGVDTTKTMCNNNFPCLIGLNCATSVGWALCNGGMDFCSKGSTFASQMTLDTGKVYYPEAIRIDLNRGTAVNPNKKVGDLNDKYKAILSNYSADTNLNSIPRKDLLKLVMIGDTLYSNSFGGGSAHAMLVVGVDDDAIYVAENGRKISKISRNDLINNRKKYVFSLLEDWYSNKNNISPEYREGGAKDE